jgi:hypothetical protein
MPMFRVQKKSSPCKWEGRELTREEGRHPKGRGSWSQRKESRSGVSHHAEGHQKTRKAGHDSAHWCFGPRYYGGP